MFEQTFKNIDDILHKDAGCTSELDYTEQSSWLLFLKYLDALEHDKAVEAELEGKTYRPIIDTAHRWESWAAPKTEDGQLDHNAALTGDDLRDYVNLRLFPYLAGFKLRATGPNTIEYKIGEIFSEIQNKIQSGYNLRDVIERVDELRFRSQLEKHELSHLYEAKIKNMGNAGRNGGEYYTPRPLIRAMVKVLAPTIGERIYDGACGSAGFLCEAFDHLLPQARRAADLKTLQTSTFYGKEKKSLAYVIAIMNMILHGIEAPNIVHANTLAENLSDIQERDRYDVILANPPFGGKERKEVQQNFPIKTDETAFLFLQHFIKSLKAGGRAGIVIKNTFLSNTDNASTSLRKLLLESCNLHTVLDCPGGTFLGAAVKTVVLFFEKGSPTHRVWFYQLNPGRNMGKTNSLNDADLLDFIETQKTFADSAQSWSIDAAGLNPVSFSLSVRNPNGGDEVVLRSTTDILDEITAMDLAIADVLKAVSSVDVKDDWPTTTIGQSCKITSGGTPSKQIDRYWQGDIPWVSAKDLKFDQIFDAALHISREALDQSATKLAPVGSLLILVRGMGLANGVPIGEVMAPVAFNQDLRSIRPPSTVLPRFLLLALRKSLLLGGTKDVLSAAAHGTLKIDADALGRIAFPVPPLVEQRRIVAILDEAFEAVAIAKANYERKLAALDELKKSLLHQAFSGAL